MPNLAFWGYLFVHFHFPPSVHLRYLPVLFPYPSDFPISNLPVTSKLLERIVAKRLLNHLDTSQLLPRLQSEHRSKHSTETALVKLLSDILLAIDSGDLAALVLLDLSAAFDTVDSAILLRRLE